MPVRSMEKGDKGIFVMKRSLAALVLLMILACALSCAHAQEVPEDILRWMAERGYENESWDSLLFDLPDGSTYAFLLNDWSLYGFLQKDGAWQNHSSGSIMSGHAGLHFERHRQGQARADGSTWPDDLGFDIVSEDGSRLSYRYDGQWFSICGWYDPQRYSGEVIVQGTRLSYYEGGTQPVASVDAGDALLSWIGDFRWHPATPAEAQAREKLLEQNVQDAFAGYTLQSYDPYNSGTGVNAAYLRISDGMLAIRRATFTLEGETVADSMPVPLSETLLARLETEPVSDLIDASGWGDTFLTDDALDTGRLPVVGTVLVSDLQSGGLVLLVEDAAGDRRVQVIVMNDNGTYRQSCLTAPLPPDTTLDLFHTTDGEINFSWDGQHAQAGYALGADGQWRLEWAWIPNDAGTLEYSCRFWGVSVWPQKEENDGMFVGDLAQMLLDGADLATLPGTREALAAALNRDGWAVVRNPDPADRLHLRVKPDRSAESLGKFYNGTPLRVLGQEGDWTRVALGLNGPEGWMMTRYLAFGGEMDEVEPVFPQLMYVLEQEERQPAYSAPRKGTEKELAGAVFVVGVVEDEFYILLTDLGDAGYVPQSWLWEGNG